MHKRLLATGVFAAACAAPLALPSAFAQAYPVKPIRMVVPYPPGGVDITIRQLLPYMDADLGQPTVIDYRAGAGGLIGTEFVARAEADGYTLLATASNPWVVTPALRKQTPYHPITSFTPITTVSQGGVNLIVANLDFPPNNLSEMFAYAKKQPDKVAWAISFALFTIGAAAEVVGYAGVTFLHMPDGALVNDLILREHLVIFGDGLFRVGEFQEQEATRLVHARRLRLQRQRLVAISPRSWGRLCRTAACTR